MYSPIQRVDLEAIQAMLELADDQRNGVWMFVAP